MTVLQSTYSDSIAVAYPGMVANGELSNRISRSIQDSGGVGFGKAVYRGTGDHDCTATQTLTATSAAAAGNTGNGAMGSVTVSAGAKIGVYTLSIIEPGTNAGKFTVTAPDGVVIGNGTVGSAFSAGGLAFTLADGATDFSSGDAFTITVAGNAFLGITVATSGLAYVAGQTADKYQRYDNVTILPRGSIYVTAGGSVTDGDPVFVDSAGDFVSSGGVPLPGWVFDVTGSDDDIVLITRR